MSPIGPDNFQRLEELSSFPSCIKCFGKPIIPPLLTPSRRLELKQLKAAAVNKEAELLRKKNELLNQQIQDIHVSSKNYTDAYRSDFQSSVQESCALWYPSSKDFQEGISVAISKLPTSGIYSSVHTGAIVCSNVIEDSHAYTARMVRDSLFGSEASVMDCVECSHNNINLECSLCQAEYNQSFHNRSFTSEISPEVPCRTFSLLQQNVVDNELNSTVEETECESLPTVICNQKYVIPDTDSESNATCMTQSTDLEKYMEFSCEFSSPDNSALIWDSKSSSQQYTLSRSDDVSSETIVNTENELTPCASTMAELTDNIEDELSNADETAGISDNKYATSGTLKRAHSVDSYMKIIQTCARSMNVKKSLSEPFNTNQEIDDETKISVTSKAALLIKEDSKESEESKEIPERDVSIQENNEEIVSKDDKITVLKPDDNNTFQKKHIRQNSYTLDQPSSVLILAHADCTCNFDANCLSPHCSALKGENEITSFSAFMKEKVEIDIPVSHQMQKLPSVNSESSSIDITSNTEHLTSPVVDVFPVVNEDSCEKSNSGNTNLSERTSAIEANSKPKLDEEEHLNEVFSEILDVSKSDKNLDYFKRFYKDLQESREMRVNELLEEQTRQRLKLVEEFKKQEKILYEKLYLPIISSTDSLPGGEEKNKLKNIEDCDDVKTPDNIVSEEKNTSINNSSISSEQTPTPDNSLIQNSKLTVSSESPQSHCSPSKSISQNTRASISPSTEFKSPNYNPSKLLENIDDIQMHKDSNASLDCNIFHNNEDNINPNISESLPFVNGYASSTSPTLLPHCSKLPKPSDAVAVSSDKNCDNLSACFCDKSPKQCECCTSFNGYCGYDINNSYQENLSFSEDINSISDIKDLSSEVELCYLQNSSSTSGIQSKNLNPEDFIHHHNINKSRSPISSKTADDSVSATQNAALAVLKSMEMSSAASSEDKTPVFPLSLKEKAKLPVDSIISLCAKTLKNGSYSSQNASTIKKINDDPILMKKFEKLPAFVKGYLTRRLFKTERVQSLIKTLQDTALLIGKLSEDLSSKGDSVSERDVDFHRQLIVQLMTTFHNVYDIFCTVNTKERMNIIAESRNFRLRQKRLEQKQESGDPVTTKAPDPAPSKKNKLSSATLKALERKRSTIDNRTYTLEDFKNVRSRSMIENRTYTIQDLKSFRGRSHSSMPPKSLSVSPSTIYKTSVGVPIKRKTASMKASRSRQCLHHKWVP